MSVIYEYEKYISTLDNVTETLEQYGVAIIPSILSDEECAEMEQGMWNTLETWSKTWETPITKNNPESWKGIRDLFPKHSMLIQQFSLGHAQFIWNLRQNPKCINIFAKIWNCTPEELLVSFDAASFHMPPETTKIGWHRKTWFHSDQSYTRHDFECIQSWVTAFDVNEYDGTLAIYENSHKYHKEFAEHFNITNKDNWYKLETEEQMQFYRERGCEEKYIKCPKGSMVLWDSRTIHCGVEPRKQRTMPNFRCVAYLCYMPRSKSNTKEIAKKIKAFEEMRMTSHWPCKVKLFPKMPRTYGATVKEITELPHPEINQLGRRLVGYDA
jgi:ectoine hydroxylase-related dioxygenase (phytanoyl-CoA dioxygenase family)